MRPLRLVSGVAEPRLVEQAIERSLGQRGGQRPVRRMSYLTGLRCADQDLPGRVGAPTMQALLPQPGPIEWDPAHRRCAGFLLFGMGIGVSLGLCRRPALLLVFRLSAPRTSKMVNLTSLRYAPFVARRKFPDHERNPSHAARNN